MAQTLIQSGVKQGRRSSVAFNLYKLDGTYTKTVCFKARDQQMEFKKVETPRGYLLELPKRTPNGDYTSSVHLATWDDVVAAEFGTGEEPTVGEILGGVPIVDEDGEMIGSTNLVLQADPARKAKRKVNVDA